MASRYVLGERPNFKDAVNDGRCFFRNLTPSTSTGENIFNGTHILNHNLTGGCDDEFCSANDYGSIIQYTASDGHVNGISQ